MEKDTHDTKEKPAYYAIIPASVRYADITAGAKLLFGEISALTNKEGYCWASNAYFAKLYKVDTRTITRCIAQLVKIGAIIVEDGANEQRKIYSCLDKNVTVPRQKSPSSLDKNVQHNTIANTKKKTIAETSSARVFSFSEEKKKLEDNERRDLNIIALFMEYRAKSLQGKVKTPLQLTYFIKRHLRAAKQLKEAEYTDEQLLSAFDAVSVKYRDIDWTLETVGKELTK